VNGDDVLIEYVSRIINALKQLNETELKPLWVNSVDKFVRHNVWHTPDLLTSQFTAPLWRRLELRLVEMKERRKRLLKSIYKKDGRLNEFE
jgi:hypothetical protein